MLAYLRRLLIDGGTAATALFGSLFAATVAALADLESAGVLRPTADAPARAAFLLINDLAVVLLRDEVARVIGVDPLEPSRLPAVGEHRDGDLPRRSLHRSRRDVEEDGMTDTD